MDRLRTFMTALGVRPRPPAEPASLDRLETTFGVRLPEEFRDLYLTADGFEAPNIRLDFESLASIEKYAGTFPEPLGVVPFTDSNDSNPYAVCCREPLAGFIAHLHHDGDPRLVCRSVGRFLDLTEDEFRRNGPKLRMEDMKGDFELDRPERTPDDARVGRDLAKTVSGLDADDSWRTTLLMFASQLFGPGDEADLDGLLTLGDEYVRESVLARLRHLGTPASRSLLKREARQYDEFIAGLAEALRAAGLGVEHRSGHPHDWRVMPGNHGLNFPMLYKRRHEPNFLQDLVERIKGWSRRG